MGQGGLTVGVERAAALGHPDDHVAGLRVVVAGDLARHEVLLESLEVGAVRHRAEQLQHAAVEIGLLHGVLGADHLGDPLVELVGGQQLRLDRLVELQATLLLDEVGDLLDLLVDRAVDAAAEQVGGAALAEQARRVDLGRAAQAAEEILERVARRRRAPVGDSSPGDGRLRHRRRRRHPLLAATAAVARARRRSGHRGLRGAGRRPAREGRTVPPPRRRRG